MRWNIEHLADDARRTGARIVSMAGFDCMPSDMLAFHAVRFLREQGLAPAQLTVTTGDLKGAASGGTLHTVCTIFEDFPLSGGRLSTLYVPYWRA